MTPLQRAHFREDTAQELARRLAVSAFSGTGVPPGLSNETSVSRYLAFAHVFEAACQAAHDAIDRAAPPVPA